MPAEGCTEPIAIAYASALAAQVLDMPPDHIEVYCSRSVIKNANSALVPGLNGLKGIKAAAIAGTLGGRPEKELEVLSGFDPVLISKVRELIETSYCMTGLLRSDDNLHIATCAHRGKTSARVEIKHRHNNIVSVQRNGRVLRQNNEAEEQEAEELYSSLNLWGIYDFAKTVEHHLIADLMEKQIESNIAICEEGLKKQYGAGIGRILLDSAGSDVERRACAYAAAGSDARMGGCSMAVVINSGSGNQGITVTAPVWVYAKHLRVSKETLHRALCLSNMVSIYIKSKTGRLSAYCGAVSAACGSGAGISFLSGGTYEQTVNTVCNALVYISGIVCDGAKPSCAAKIASSVQAAILGHHMAMRGRNFQPGDGMTGDTPEETLKNIGLLAKEGLAGVDPLMLTILMEKSAHSG